IGGTGTTTGPCSRERKAGARLTPRATRTVRAIGKDIGARTATCREERRGTIEPRLATRASGAVPASTHHHRVRSRRHGQKMPHVRAAAAATAATAVAGSGVPAPPATTPGLHKGFCDTGWDRDRTCAGSGHLLHELGVGRAGGSRRVGDAHLACGTVATVEAARRDPAR